MMFGRFPKKKIPIDKQRLTVKNYIKFAIIITSFPQWKPISQL